LPSAPLPTGAPENVAQEPTWQPSSDRLTESAGVHLQAPQTEAGEQNGTVRLAPPETPEPPTNKSTPPPTVKERQTPDAPLDIPEYAIARNKVANGQKPFPDGIDWLKKQGYRAVLHVMAPGEDDTAARKLFETKGLRYEILEVSPRTLNRELVDRFTKLVTEEARLPLFVYDKDGSLTGVLWYLYYRIAIKMDDAAAREEAKRLGFKPESEEQRTLLLAAKTLLEEIK
jgi:hypothetical protein